MHPRNPYAERRPDFAALTEENPQLKPYVTVIDGHEPSINFTNPAALRALSAALLKTDFGLDVALRDDRLCPTIANRLDYILTCLDLPLPPDAPLRVLDIGTGHVAIYPLLLHRLRPSAQVYGSELDDVSLTHAREVVAANGIASVPLDPPWSSDASSSDPSRPTPSAASAPAASPPTPSGGGITLLPASTTLLGHPIYPLSFTLCNPPFFASEAEALSSRAAKPEGTSAPTCSANEEVTRGGETAFVAQMIDESVAHKHECAWFTSLVGKYASLPALVAQVRGITGNYGVVRLQQSRTVRWVLIWGFGNERLKDEMTRPAFIDPTTSFARLLPPPNTFSATSALGVRELADKVTVTLESVGMQGFPAAQVEAIEAKDAKAARQAEATDADGDKEETATEEAADKPGTDETASISAVGVTNDKITVTLAPKSNTWSRAARRAAATGTTSQPSETAARVADPPDPPEPLFRADLSVQRTESGSTLTLVWTWGAERGVVDAFWKFVVTKTGLRGEKREREDGDADSTSRGGREGSGGRGAPRGRGAGGRGGGGARGGPSGRGRGRGSWDKPQDAGWTTRNK